MAAPSYAVTMPTPEELRERLMERKEYWRPRDEFIKLARDMIHGKNNIKLPKSTQFVPVRHRTYMLAGSVNEKRARFLNRPEVSIIADSIGMDAVSEATKLEHALGAAMEEMERNSEGNVWDSLVMDCIYLDEGVERIERAPAAFWPELIVNPDDGKDTLERLFEDATAYKKAKEEYKKQAGLPLRSSYVPLESFYPIYEGPTMVECMELETRSLRSVLSNPLFSAAKSALSMYPLGKDGGLSTMVTIVRYCNQWVYGYFALAPAQMNGPYKWPDAAKALDINIGKPIFLYGYKHKLGMPLYNAVGGRFGGWKTANNGIEPVIRALLELNQQADELKSQVHTNIRARYWPNLKWQLNPEYRMGEGNTPKAPKLTDGEPIPLFVGEDLKPIWEPKDDPMTQWAYQKINEEFSRIAGSAVTSGDRQPGVNTGFHQSLQITQAEHLDEKIEQNLAQGARKRAEIMCGHIKAMDETVWVARPEIDRRKGRKYLRWLSISPDQLAPLPRMDPRVRKPKPIDFLQSLRAARDASANRRGQGTPMLSDLTIYEEILGVEEPDIEMKKIWMQNEMQKLFDSGFLSGKVSEGLDMAMASQSQPLKPGAEGNMDPALQAAMQQQMGQTQQSGGISPPTAAAVQGLKPKGTQGNQQPHDPGIRRPGGGEFGAPQPEQQIAFAMKQGQLAGQAAQ